MMVIMVVCNLFVATICASEIVVQPTVIAVTGAPGEEEFGKQFEEQAALWEKAARGASARSVILRAKDAAETNQLAQLEKTLRDEPKDGAGGLWLVLLGHGTFDGKEARFNLRGPDLTSSDLAEWLKSFRRPLVVINTASSSAPFLAKLAGTNRVVLSSTRSGYEQNYARFGQYLSEAIGDAQADIDKDGQVSLLEAFLTASHRVAEFYQREGRLATEHPLIDDNGDGQGTPADWFRGVRAVKKSATGAALDGVRAHQVHLIRSQAEQALSPTERARRDELELAIATLRDAKATLPEAEYFQRLEILLLELGRLYEPKSAP
ncbi:MAG: hypothetical protein HY043_03045 [Verrucomicrobia bacterium]|nr:hypothetical protein [Verrucomicrobiota bacterium]